MKKIIIFAISLFFLLAPSVNAALIPNDEKYEQTTYTWPNGDKYVGQWKEDKKHGQGTMTYANGSKYSGKFSNGKPLEQLR